MTPTYAFLEEGVTYRVGRDQAQGRIAFLLETGTVARAREKETLVFTSLSEELQQTYGLHKREVMWFHGEDEGLCGQVECIRTGKILPLAVFEGLSVIFEPKRRAEPIFVHPDPQQRVARSL